ncbi:MAG: CBS domain-containing protein [Actinomycetota bacterium]
MRVGELVGAEVVGIEANRTLREAIRLMSESEVGALAVQRDGRLTGIFTERDVIRACTDQADLDSVLVESWMTSDPDSLDPDMNVEAAADWMLAAGYRHLPVVDGVNLIGMVSIKDILWAVKGPSAG